LQFQAPDGFDEIVARYGDIRAFIRADGTILPDWERQVLGMVTLPGSIPLSWDKGKLVSRFRCHTALVEPFGAAFRAIREAGLWAELREFGGCYAFRTQRGSASHISLHAWGAAVDLNPSTNKLGQEDGDMHPGIIQCFEANGFFWGGRFGRPDPMHFQGATGY
jgi:hypothetical protein